MNLIYNISMETKPIYTFTITDSENVSEERIVFVAEDVAGAQAEEQEWEFEYALKLEKVENVGGEKHYHFSVVALDGHSDQDEDEEIEVRPYTHRSVAAASSI